jgi:hypothetical protein
VSAPIPFHPIEFYRLAVTWNASGSALPEALSRSIASRAYYAAFLSARAAAKLNTYTNTHATTAKHYLSQGGPGNQRIGNGLFALHALRKAADYDFAPTFQQTRAARALNLSKDVLKALKLTP